MSGGAHAPVVPVLPPRVPRMPRGRIAPWLGRTVLRLGGWRVEGELPDIPKAVVIAAPHSSNWDGFWGIAAKLALGIRLSILGKHTLFRIPLLAPLLRWQGVIPVNRAAPQGVVEQAVAAMRARDVIWYAMAPEGTRRPVAQWKPGFWRIAHAAQVPVVVAAFDYPRRRIVLGPAFATSDDMAGDIARIQRWYAPFKGRHHDVRQPA
ncbi:1-acyl-sn-glycerol-3-phosphate acyltransferase [Thermomonas alba]|uniref:1-acyl-sn-glycerol-3-phosphate acyltransferase n=1 Tax=Thermomonas alba TaxID=2888525 RepID=UPI001F034EB2|nr:1-acyl-sn-glycerol-3-phosphate acyltransferase [Thermomonas alba]